MKPLFLADLKELNECQVLAHLAESWKASEKDLKGIELLIGYESVGDYGCDSNGFYLFRRGHKLFEVHGSHCSCFGFEDQWKPEPTSLTYLRSEKFIFATGGYDDANVANHEAVKERIKQLRSV